ncbi:hypothetical protein H7D82_000864 [Salmonella enterica]|nr:hypothetical protein [Salmonella enterica]EKB7612300.1 hypothetical protein [Salmonella enterica]
MSLFHYFRARPVQHTFCIMHCIPLALFLTAVFSPFGTWSGDLFIWMVALLMVLLWGGMALYTRKTDRLRHLTDSPEVNIRRGKTVVARMKQHEKAQLMWEVLQDDDVLREQLNAWRRYLVRIISRSVAFTPVALVFWAGAGAWLLPGESAVLVTQLRTCPADTTVNWCAGMLMVVWLMTVLCWVVTDASMNRFGEDSFTRAFLKRVKAFQHRTDSNPARAAQLSSEFDDGENTK